MCTSFRIKCFTQETEGLQGYNLLSSIWFIGSRPYFPLSRIVYNPIGHVFDN
jgi:hypothetical protein